MKKNLLHFSVFLFFVSFFWKKRKNWKINNRFWNLVSTYVFVVDWLYWMSGTSKKSRKKKGSKCVSRHHLKQERKYNHYNYLTVCFRNFSVIHSFHVLFVTCFSIHRRNSGPQLWNWSNVVFLFHHILRSLLLKNVVVLRIVFKTHCVRDGFLKHFVLRNVIPNVPIWIRKKI